MYHEKSWIFMCIYTYILIHMQAYTVVRIIEYQLKKQIWSCNVNSSHGYICTYTVWILLFTLNFIHFKLSGHVRGSICWLTAGVPMRSGLPKSRCMFMHSSCFSTDNQTWTTHYTLPCVCVETKPEKMGDWQHYIGLKGMILTEQPVNNKTPIQFTMVDGRNPTYTNYGR